VPVLVGCVYAVVWVAAFALVYRRTKHKKDRGGRLGMIVMVALAGIAMVTLLFVVLTA
jgi:hypothetical protein